jgi:type IV pilus assembly protein PilB
MRRARRLLGEILLGKGLISQVQLDEALEIRKSGTDRIGKILLDLKYITENDLAAALGEQLNVPVVDMAKAVPDPKVTNVVPTDLIYRYTVLPLRRHEDGGLVIAMADPTDVVARDDLRNRCGVTIHPVVAGATSIKEAIDAVYYGIVREDFDATVKEVGKSRGASAAEMKMPGTGAEVGQDDLAATEGGEPELHEAGPVVRMCNTLIKQAIKEEASDIHVEPGRQRVRVRYRIDGVLHEIMQLPKYIHLPLVSRIKIMSEMNIAERRIPLDGRVSVRQDGQYYDLRVSTIPTIYGEKAVMRILYQSGTMIGLERLGFLPYTMRQLEELVVQPNGMILSTGPTGHGKTTTQYSILSRLNSVEKNIITIEDPVEYQLPNISQVAVNPRAGLTFANAMRSFVRQDPDIILIGEIRDFETADTAIQASLTGHLVLSTLHTNSAPSSVTRLVDMGVEPFLISATLIGALAQRLGRRVCSYCKVPHDPSDEMLALFGYDPAKDDGKPEFVRGEGCERCRYTGYKGRIGLFEFMRVGSEVAELIVRRAPLADVTEAARAGGMRTLKEDGFEKVKMGITTADEVARVVFTAGLD